MGTLIADKLRTDPRIAQAKELILSAVQEHQAKLNQVQAADPERKQSYEEALKAFGDVRGGKLYYPYIGSGLGNGPFVELLDGSVKYDFIIGIGVHYLGHSHPDLVSASIDASIGNSVMQGHLQQNLEQYELCKLLCHHSGLDHCFLSTTGVMANENALKIIFQNRHPASRILAFERCFMGRTLALSQVTDKAGGRVGLPLNVQVDYIPPYDYRDPEGSLQRAKRALVTYLDRYPQQHAVMCFELVQGEGGFYPGAKEFFVPLMEILKERGVKILVDEVQTFGRTPRLFAFQYFELDDYVDVVTIGKLSQVCATLYRSELKPKPGLLSQTFTAATSSVFAALTLIRKLIDEGFYGPDGKIARTHAFFCARLQEISNKYPDLLEGPYGVGAMVAFTPLGGNPQAVNQLAHKLFEAGVLSFVAGSHPTRLRFLIPVGVVTEEHIVDVCQILEETLLSVAAVGKV